jgi:hypothetical protein
MKEIRTEVIIKASPKKVWSCFSDFKHYAGWNPFIHSIEGSVNAGNTVTIKLTPPNAKPMIFKPRVLTFEQNRELRWIGHFIIPGLFDGEHIFELIDNNDGTTRFIQREIFTGIMVPFLKKMLDDNTRRGFESMNQKLKEKCE